MGSLKDCPGVAMLLAITITVVGCSILIYGAQLLARAIL